MNRLPELPKLAVASVTCWLVFELINFSLGNWHYLGVPPARLLALAGLCRRLCHGPAGSVSDQGSFGRFRRFCPGPGDRCGSRGPPGCPPATIAGLVLLVLPFLWPRYFFPLPWLAFIFLLDPFCYLGGGTSLWADWCRGRRREMYLLLLAGLICGFFWEFWNYWAKAKWVYTLPYFQCRQDF